MNHTKPKLFTEEYRPGKFRCNTKDPDFTISRKAPPLWGFGDTRMEAINQWHKWNTVEAQQRGIIPR